MFLLNLTLLATAFLRCATAQLPALEDPGQDLASYVSVSEQNPVPVDHRRLSRQMNCLTIPQRPDLRPPLLNVTRYDADAITPGYLFHGAICFPSRYFSGEGVCPVSSGTSYIRQ
jgi:hypothetical protein